MNNYFEWLNNDINAGYFLLTWFLLAIILFIVLYTTIFIIETIDKNKKVEEIEEELKKLKSRKRGKK